MAIYHFTAKIVSRKEGRSVVGAAAYRAGIQLKEASTGIVYDYTRKRGVEHTEIIAPEGAPDWVHDRQELWNAVEQIEKRKDAQLARDVEIALPVELDPIAQVELLRDFVRREFVSRGMIADLAIHRDNPNNPHAHVLLTQRRITESGFGPKERSWNQKSLLMIWRARWAEVANHHLAKAGLTTRIDHRTLQAQGLDLIPGRKIGVSLDRQQSNRLPPRVAERVAEQRDIASENGARIIANPKIALQALTHYQATFTEHDIARFLHTRTDGAEQFHAAYLKVTTNPELFLLGEDDRGHKRYTSREMVETEAEMLYRAELMSLRQSHRVADRHIDPIASAHGLVDEQREALKHLTAANDLSVLVGVAGSGKSRLLAAARESWEARGYTVKGGALAGIAAENLTKDAGIAARTLASYELAWAAGRDLLTPNDVLVIDEAGMLGTRQMARVLEAAAAAQAKVVLVGDAEQLTAIEAGAPFRGIAAETGYAELTQIWRQNHDWQKAATRQFSKGETTPALEEYERRGAVVQVTTRAAARSTLVSRWAQDAHDHPEETRMMLAYTRYDVRHLNNLAREFRRKRGELGRSELIETERGMREFATRDRIYFLRNERSLGVKNGTLGTIEHIKDGMLEVRLDGRDEHIQVDTRFYKDLDHGYAATIHKAQGTTVDRTYVLATAHFDRHATYVALSRHREETTVVYATENFGPPPGRNATATPEQGRQAFLDVLSRNRPKELAHDYLEREDNYRYIPTMQEPSLQESTSIQSHPVPKRSPGATMREIDALQQRGAERWRDKQLARQAGLPTQTRLEHESDLDLNNSTRQREIRYRPELEHPDPEDDLEL